MGIGFGEIHTLRNPYTARSGLKSRNQFLDYKSNVFLVKSILRAWSRFWRNLEFSMSLHVKRHSSQWKSAVLWRFSTWIPRVELICMFWRTGLKAPEFGTRLEQKNEMPDVMIIPKVQGDHCSRKACSVA